MTLKSIAELVYRQVYPNPSDEAPITLVEFIESAKLEYAYRLWERNRLEMRDGADNDVASNLLSRATLPVKDKTASIADINPLRSLPSNTWLQLVGGVECGDCKYVVMDLNKYKLLCDDESRGDNKAVIPMGSNLYFPDGLFDNKNEIDIVYANLGSDLDDDTNVDEAVGNLVRTNLFNIYSKQMPEDKTNNSNPNS